MTDVRAAWNTMHGTELPHHDDILTAEQAARINAYYRIEVYTGTHGRGHAEFGYLANPLVAMLLPTQAEYQAVAGVVTGMGPNDVLFREGYGFDQPPVNSTPGYPLYRMDTFNLGSYQKRILGPQLFAGVQAARERQRQEKVDAAARARDNYAVDAWWYAHALAEARETPVVMADHDAFDVEKTQELRPESTIVLINSPNPEDRAFAEQNNADRERKARNIVKNWALNNLPPEGTPVPDPEDRPRLILLFGEHHKEGLEKAFNELGINAYFESLYQSSMDERQFEQLARYIGMALRGLLVNLLVHMAHEISPQFAAVGPTQQLALPAPKPQLALTARPEDPARHTQASTKPPSGAGRFKGGPFLRPV